MVSFGENCYSVDNSLFHGLNWIMKNYLNPFQGWHILHLWLGAVSKALSSQYCHARETSSTWISGVQIKPSQQWLSNLSTVTQAVMGETILCIYWAYFKSFSKLIQWCQKYIQHILSIKKHNQFRLRDKCLSVTFATLFSALLLLSQMTVFSTPSRFEELNRSILLVGLSLMPMSQLAGMMDIEPVSC